MYFISTGTNSNSFFGAARATKITKYPLTSNIELLVGNNGGVVAPPNGELVPTYGVYIVPWAPTMRIDTSTASSTLLIVEI